MIVSFVAIFSKKSWKMMVVFGLASLGVNLWLTYLSISNSAWVIRILIYLIFYLYLILKYKQCYNQILLNKNLLDTNIFHIGSHLKKYWNAVLRKNLLWSFGSSTRSSSKKKMKYLITIFSFKKFIWFVWQCRKVLC